MRVYEYAKIHGVLHRDVLDFLKESGFRAQSHMSIVPPEALSALDKKFKQEAGGSAGGVVDAPSDLPSVAVFAKPPAIVGASAPAIASDRQPVVGVVAVDGIVFESMVVSDFASRAKKSIGDVILTLLRQGVVAAKNQVISERVVEGLARHYGIAIIAREESPVEKYESPGGGLWAEGLEERLPVVVVMGHVDHGKTTLLDFIRKTRVVAKEKGGITQHLGAYEVYTKHGNVVFIDTPGHEAFAKIRERGTHVADVAILVVAADDGIMPQTIEVIRRVQAAQIPLVVAINKIDKASPQQVESVKRGLTQYGIIPEDWGGQVACVPISAKTGVGVDDLLELLVLQTKMMELMATFAGPAHGYVIEAKKDRGRGIVATVICRHGILHVGDYFIAGNRKTGKVTSIVDSLGKRLRQIHPSQPAQITGFNELPQAGDFFEVISSEQVKKIKQKAPVDFPTGMQHVVAGEEGFNLVVKADNDSSREALVGAFEKINEKAFKPLHIIAAGVGNVTESDVQLACDTHSMIYAFHSKIEPGSSALALKCGVVIRQFDIIYRLLDEAQAMVSSGRPVKKVLKKTGEAVVLKVFDIKNLGIVAGIYVRSGRISKDARVIVWRGQYKVGEGSIKSLQRDKKPVKEALTGFECAFMIDGFSDWLVDDRVEAYLEVPQA